MVDLIDKQDAELARIADRIAALFAARYVDGKPYLISLLGNDLGDDLRQLKLLTQSTLTEFIRKRLREKVQVVLFGEHSTVAALIAADVVMSEKDRREAVFETRMAPRFHYRFWAAFSVPATKRFRYLHLEDLRFVDTDIDIGSDTAEQLYDDTSQASAGLTDDHKDQHVQGSKWVLIGNEFIAQDGLERRDLVVKENISRWLKENNFEELKFYSSSHDAGKRAEKSQSAQSPSLLHLLVEALDKRQQLSLHLSVDVISTLLNTRRP